MPIHYALFRNFVSPGVADYAAIVKPTASVGLDAMIERMIDRGSTTARADILAVLEDAIGATEALLLDGMRVNFGGLVELFPRIRGVFDDATDSFDASRHAIDVGANPGVRVRRTVRSTGTVVKEEAIKPAPNPLQFRDVGSSTTDDQVTPGNIGELVGSRLKFDPAQADEGVFFIPTALGSEVQVTTFQRNKPSSLVFLVPDTLTTGDYQIEVRARIAGGTELRTGRLEAVLTVP